MTQEVQGYYFSPGSYRSSVMDNSHICCMAMDFEWYVVTYWEEMTFVWHQLNVCRGAHAGPKRTLKLKNLTVVNLLQVWRCRPPSWPLCLLRWSLARSQLPSVQTILLLRMLHTSRTSSSTCSKQPSHIWMSKQVFTMHFLALLGGLQSGNESSWWSVWSTSVLCFNSFGFSVVCDMNYASVWKFCCQKTARSSVLAWNPLAVYELDQILRKVNFLNVLRSCAPNLSR